MYIITKYFALTKEQEQKFAALEAIYALWNSRINVISRKDMDNFYERHVLHSLSIAKVITFKEGTSIMDVGTGGGFPGIPLAIMFPSCKFLLVDSIGKKINVVKAVAEELGLNNVEVMLARAETVEKKFDFIVSRAVTELPEFYKWTGNKIKNNGFNAIPNGILYLKGGDISNELKQLKAYNEVFELKDFFEEEFFETKKLVFVY
ncbi:MAG: 16S rRNA (guanine(527)-N(7))-methyltransferase RsmG [Bacteroidales bacterium]|jgi:16S rRNA (guanine527-N7)-methyltransferase